MSSKVLKTDWLLKPVQGREPLKSIVANVLQLCSFVAGSVRQWLLMYFTDETWFYFKNPINTQKRRVGRWSQSATLGAMTWHISVLLMQQE